MKYTYQELQQYNVVIRTDDDGNVCSIPMDEGNSDYQRYLNPNLEQSGTLS